MELIEIIFTGGNTKLAYFTGGNAKLAYFAVGKSLLTLNQFTR
jgi:hypothetical protein